MTPHRDRCACGEPHEDDVTAVTPATTARMRAYLAANPAHQFAVDEDSGIVALIRPRDPVAPEIIAWSTTLPDLLTQVDAPPPETLS